MESGEPDSNSIVGKDEEELAEAPTLDQRLERLSEVDRKVMDVLSVSREMLQSFDKERQISKTKMDELFKRYSKCLEDIDAAVGSELQYMEHMCVGAEHQGSTSGFQQQAKLAGDRILQMGAGLENCSALLQRQAPNNRGGADSDL